MQDLVHFRPRLQPMGDDHAAHLVMAQPHAHGAEPTQGEVAVVGRGMEAE